MVLTLVLRSNISDYLLDKKETQYEMLGNNRVNLNISN